MPTTTQPATPPTDLASRWTVARSYVGQLGQIPSSFTTATRMLAQDPAADCSLLSDSTRFLVHRLMRTGTIKTALSFAAVTFKPERHSAPSAVDLNAVLADYRPLDLAAVIGLIYIYRRARAICPADEWTFIDAQLTRHLDTSMHVGYALVNAGVAAGVFVGGFTPLGQALFLKHDYPGFKEYRRHLSAKKLLFDADFEMARWGCSSPLLAAFFIQTLGLGIPLAERFSIGMESVAQDGQGLDDAAYKFYITKRWLMSLLTTGDIPDMTHQGRYYPLKTAQDRLKELTVESGTNGSRYRWLEKTKEDLASTGKVGVASSAEPEGDDIAAALETE